MVLQSARTRKAAGCAVLLIYIGLYGIAAAALGAGISAVAPWWAQLIYFAIAGVIWILPLKPLFGWMNRGR